MTFFRALILVITSAAASDSVGADCTLQEAFAAERTASTLRSWPEVHSAFIRYGHCDDGAIGEGFSDRFQFLSQSIGLRLADLAS